MIWSKQGISRKGTIRRNAFQILTLGLTVIAANASSIAATYDLSDGFSPTNNPNGPWTYGWQGSLGGAFSALPAPVTPRADGGVPFSAWQLTDFQTPGVYKNT